MKKIQFNDSELLYPVGLGTWQMGEINSNKQNELNTIFHAIDSGIQLIDTAEMYGEGKTELLLKEVVKKKRNEIFLVSKFYPMNASKNKLKNALENSLSRLGTDWLDLYLLHWPSNTPFDEIIESINIFKKSGKIRYFGVSNYSYDELKNIENFIQNKSVVTNQVYYSLNNRGIEFDLLPYTQSKDCVTMAYSPFDQGEIFKNKKFMKLCDEFDFEPAAAVVKFLLNKDYVLPIPKTSNLKNLKKMLNDLEKNLTKEYLESLSEIFPTPRRKSPLAII